MLWRQTHIAVENWRGDIPPDVSSPSSIRQKFRNHASVLSEYPFAVQK